MAEGNRAPEHTQSASSPPDPPWAPGAFPSRGGVLDLTSAGLPPRPPGSALLSEGAGRRTQAADRAPSHRAWPRPLGALRACPLRQRARAPRPSGERRGHVTRARKRAGPSRAPRQAPPPIPGRPRDLEDALALHVAAAATTVHFTAGTKPRAPLRVSPSASPSPPTQCHPLQITACCLDNLPPCHAQILFPSPIRAGRPVSPASYSAQRRS